VNDLPKNVDASSLVISYLWTHGGQAIAASLPMALATIPQGEIVHAVHDLQDRGWVDLLHEELAAVKLTHEARLALQQHVTRGTPLPERLERASDVEARLREAQLHGARAQVELVQLLREQREELRLMREERQLPGGRPAARALETRVSRRCACAGGPLGQGRFCGECGGVA